MIQTGARTEALLRLYQDALGETSDSHVYGSESLPAPLHVCRYDTVVSGVSALMTAGLSEYASVIGSPIEVVLLTTSHADELADFLVTALRFAIKHSLPIAEGFSLQGLSAVNATLAASSGKEALYFTGSSTLPAPLQAIESAQGDVKLLHAVLISSPENEYFLDHGSEALEQKLTAKAIADPTLNRASTV